MKRILFDELMEYSLVRANQSEAEFPIPVHEKPVARQFLAQIFQGWFNARTIRAFLDDEHFCNVHRMSDREIFEFFSGLISRGEVLLIPRGGHHLENIEGLSISTEKERRSPKAPLTQPRQAWIRLKFIEAENKIPISGIKLQIRKPDGRSITTTTAEDGTIRVSDLASGYCEASCEYRVGDERVYGIVETSISPATRAPSAKQLSQETKGKDPAVVVLLEKYAVKRGETLESIASSVGVSWRKISWLNWRTVDPDEIDWHMTEDVGCPPPDKSKSKSGDHASESSGLVIVPRTWKTGALEVNKTHIFLVKPLRGRFDIRLDVNPEASGHVNDRFRLYSSDGSYEQILTVADDMVAGDGFLDLPFRDLPRDKNFSFEILSGEDGTKREIFSELPYSRLNELSPRQWDVDEEEQNNLVEFDLPTIEAEDEEIYEDSGNFYLGSPSRRLMSCLLDDMK